MNDIMFIADCLRCELVSKINDRNFDKRLSQQIDLVQKVIDIEEEIQRDIQLPR